MACPFIVGFVARSGSSPLVLDLDRHPDIKMRLEVFGTPLLPAWGGAREQTDENRLEWLRWFWRDRAAPRRARGFKLQFNRGRPQFDDLARFADTLRQMGAVVVRLRRDDRVRHAVSALRADALQQINRRVAGHEGAHIYPGAPEEVRAFAGQPIRIEVAAFEAMLESIAVNAAYRDGFMAGFAEVVEVSYEDYLADRLAVLNTIARAVEVAPFDAAPPEHLSKNTSDDLSLAVTNYDEIAEAARRLGLEV